MIFFKNILIAISAIMLSFSAFAQNWSSSMSMTLTGRNGYFSFGLTEGNCFYSPCYSYVQPGVVIAPPPVVFPAYVPSRSNYCDYNNCGRYPQGNPCDPYRNHRHLQR